MRRSERVHRVEELAGIDAQRICLIKPSALGDVVQALPVLSALRDRFESAHIAWVVERSYANLLAGHPHLDEIIDFDRRRTGHGAKPWSASLRGFAHRLRAKQFDLVCDLQGLLRSGLMARATGAKWRIGMSDSREGARCCYTHRVLVPPEIESAVERYWVVARALGAGTGPKQFVVPIDNADRQWAADQLNPLTGLRVAMHPGARWMTKRWPAEHFANIARRLDREFAANCILLGSPAEQYIAGEITGAVARRCINLVGQTSLKQLAAVLSLVDLMVTNDSGPMHLAAALGVPVVALYTCTSPRRAAPFGTGHTVIPTTIWCAASYLKQCARLECMDELTPERVWPMLKQKLLSLATANSQSKQATEVRSES